MSSDSDSDEQEDDYSDSDAEEERQREAASKSIARFLGGARGGARQQARAAPTAAVDDGGFSGQPSRPQASNRHHRGKPNTAVARHEDASSDDEEHGGGGGGDNDNEDGLDVESGVVEFWAPEAPLKRNHSKRGYDKVIEEYGIGVSKGGRGGKNNKHDARKRSQFTAEDGEGDGRRTTLSEVKSFRKRAKIVNRGGGRGGGGGGRGRR